MTWIFTYSILFLLGLLLAGSTGLLRRLPFFSHHHNVVLPAPEHHVTAFNALARRVSVGLALFGLVGVLLAAMSDTEPRTHLAAAAVAGVAGALLAALFMRQRCADVEETRDAVAVRDIPPGGYGQVRFDRSGANVMMAAQNVDTEAIAAGDHVAVVDCQRSVLAIRRA